MTDHPILRFSNRLIHIRGVNGQRATPESFQDWIRIDPPQLQNQFPTISSGVLVLPQVMDMDYRLGLCEWCETHCLFDWRMTGDHAIWFFEDEDDAMAFKMFWC